MITINDEQLSQTTELERLNTFFANRYTNEDEEYQKMAKPHSPNPPIVPDWDQKKNNYPNEQRTRSNDRYNNRRDDGHRSHSNYRYDNQQRHPSNNRQYDNQSRDNRYNRDRSPVSHYRQNQRR